MQIGRNGSHLRCSSKYSSRSSSARRSHSLASARLRNSSSRSSNKSKIAAQSSGSSQNSVYTGIKTSAASVKIHASKLSSTEDESLFEKGEKNKDTSEIVKEVKAFVRDYNSMISNMKSTGSTVNNYFARELNSYATQNQTKLGEVGIKIEDNGSLTINEKTLQKAGIEDLKAVFNGSESFAEKTAAKCPNIQAKAVSDINTKAYTSSSSKYRFSYLT